MSGTGTPGGERRGARPAGRRVEDGAQSQPRERRQPPVQTAAAAQSVVMARLQDSPQTTSPRLSVASQVYAAAPIKISPEAERASAFRRDAELQYQAAQKAWVFERRRRKKPRTVVIEDAVELPPRT